MDKDNKRGIAPHLQKFYSTQLAKAQLPNLSLMASLKALNQIIKTKQQEAQNLIQARSRLETIINQDEAFELKQCRLKIKQNQQVLKVMELCKEIDIRILGFEENIQQINFDQFRRLKERLNIFRELYHLVEKLDEQFNNLANYKQNNLQKSVKSINNNNQQANKLKVQYFTKLKNRLYKAIVEIFYSKKKNQHLQSSFQYFGLPIRKQNNQLEMGSKKQSKKFENKDETWLAHSCCIIESLFSQYCCYCLQKKIQMILGEQQQQVQPAQLNSEGVIVENAQSFNSLFFSKLWHKVNKSLVYIFINSNSMNQENNAYQIDQPNWLFQYMEEIFKNNYFFVTQNILSLLKQTNQISQIVQSIQTYFVTYNFKYFFLRFILMRLDSDTKSLKEDQKNRNNMNDSSKNRTGFVIFNFLDELHILEQKLYQTYSYQPNFIESVLQWGQKHSYLDLLTLNFDYEHHWMEERIFSDFYNINYSSITDLKNVEAYNITVNFTHIFQKLYSKFRKVTDQSLKTRINLFYYEQLLKLVRHIKTSFERIYNNSGIDKYETLISYKKVQDQFKGYFNGFVQQSPTFEQKIKEQYYSVLEHYSSVLALEQLTSVHKKVYKILSDCNQIFTGQQAQEGELEATKNKWNKIFEEWQQKLSKINKIQPDYEDKKLRNIFFVFLESIQFTEDGFFYFLSMFEPFLVVLFSIEGTNILKMLLEFEKGTLKQYSKSHQNSLWFLNSSQLKSIQKAKIKDRQR